MSEEKSTSKELITAINNFELRGTTETTENIEMENKSLPDSDHKTRKNCRKSEKENGGEGACSNGAKATSSSSSKQGELKIKIPVIRDKKGKKKATAVSVKKPRPVRHIDTTSTTTSTTKI